MAYSYRTWPWKWLIYPLKMWCFPMVYVSLPGGNPGQLAISMAGWRERQINNTHEISARYKLDFGPKIGVAFIIAHPSFIVFLFPCLMKSPSI